MTANAALNEELRLKRPSQHILRVPWASDSRLVRQAKGGSPDAVEALIRRHWSKAHRTALLIVQDAAHAEDIAQEAMFAAVQSLDQFDWRQPMAPWLHRIVVNRSLDYLRARGRRAVLESEGFKADAILAVNSVPDTLSQDLVVALHELDPVDRAIVVLRHLLDYRSPEIGRLLGMPATTVRTRLRRAFAQLRDMLGDERDT
jgi:RNA polymerase sigma-70 factor (ECF subfamily)